MVIDPLTDVMSYFRFVFFAYIVLFIVISLNFYKAICIRKNASNDNSNHRLIQSYDLIIDILCGLAMIGGLIFQGVLADNNALVNTNWSNALILLSIGSLIIFILNVIVVFKKRK
ncbi:MAG: hypothetical protein ACLSV2_11755 [Clostridium sp.]